MSIGRVIRCAGVRPQPWRNGGGQTRELLVWPSANEWRVRISVADVDTDGPFSAYPDVERWFAVVAGAGVDLAIDGTMHHMNPSSPPLCFDGGANIDCRLLNGPTRDLNLMVGRGTGIMQSMVSGIAWRPDATQCGLFAVVPGYCMVDDHDDVAMPGESLLWFDLPPRTLNFRPSAQGGTQSSGWWLGYRKGD
ncbi:MAG: HutD family protein [Burkholderiales bacterium]